MSEPMNWTARSKAENSPASLSPPIKTRGPLSSIDQAGSALSTTRTVLSTDDICRRKISSMSGSAVGYRSVPNRARIVRIRTYQNPSHPALGPPSDWLGAGIGDNRGGHDIPDRADGPPSHQKTPHYRYHCRIVSEGIFVGVPAH